MQPVSTLHTGRLVLRPVAPADFGDLAALKADPRAYALILGGVRTRDQAARELADDLLFWGRNGFGMWTARRCDDAAFVGTVGLMERPDGRGIALRFALAPEARKRGYASEAAGAVLRYGHDVARLARVIAVAKETNIASRQVLGAIGMHLCDRFPRGGETMLVYESVRGPAPGAIS